MELSESFKFIAKEIREIDSNNKVISIMTHDQKTNLQVPHPITEFLTVKYAFHGKSLNSQLVPARVVCRFLNYILKSIDKKDKLFMQLSIIGLKNLNLYHGSNYISHLSRNGLSRNTIKLYEGALTNFFVFLSENNYINEKIEVEYNYYKDKRTVKSLFEKSYLQTQYPSSRKSNTILKLKDFGKNRYELMVLFIQLARSVSPDIAYGICLQFYGGLRRGEVVNVTRLDLEVIPKESMIVHIKDNRNILFSDLKDTSNEFPKRTNYLPPRLCKQIIMDIPIVWEVYFEHINYLQTVKAKNKKAMFLNKDGNAMSGKIYDRRFNKVKKRFLEELLKQGRYADYTLLSESYWSTHIGRGIYSNILFDMNLTPTQIAIARGDTNINSSMEYVDEKTTLNAIKDNLPRITKLSEKYFNN
ncbi:site-specific integrase [Psychrobacillus psychrodurans]|uniref:Site-specific integrase n=1 Tax=Psychrobacillus psychrodurans TaxID=126157 RepID=A0A9X3LBP5_9BACI|nr:site-specific integrase [Psychrobacillus psychrodurans]MCZ8535001.1 site-specific integrase [Psychrobacillus psychrodurans]